jgi:hypothetical protein
MFQPSSEGVGNTLNKCFTYEFERKFSLKGFLLALEIETKLLMSWKKKSCI